MSSAFRSRWSCASGELDGVCLIQAKKITVMTNQMMLNTLATIQRKTRYGQNRFKEESIAVPSCLIARPEPSHTNKAPVMAEIT